MALSRKAVHSLGAAIYRARPSPIKKEEYELWKTMTQIVAIHAVPQQWLGEFADFAGYPRGMPISDDEA